MTDAETQSAPINRAFSLIKKKNKTKKNKNKTKLDWQIYLQNCLRSCWHPQSQFHQKPARRFWRLCKKYGKVPVLVPWQREHNCDSRRLNKLVTHAGCFHMQEHRLKPSVLLTAIHSSKSFLTNCLHQCNFEIVFQDDAEMIFIMSQKAKFELRVPTPTLRSEGQKHKSWSMRIPWHNGSAWKKCYTPTPAKEIRTALGW